MAATSGTGQVGLVRPGGKLLCPGCETEADFLYAFKALDRPEKFSRDTNPIYKHRRDRGGCGHVFSPGDPWIIEAYLSGDLIPATVVTELRQTVSELQAIIATSTPSDERRPVSA
jgi:hypothetical protein